MSYSVTCSACGHQNPLGRLFCAKCGTKLAITPAAMGGGRGPAGFWLARLARVAIFLAVLGAFLLLLRPVEPDGAPGTLPEASALAQKLNVLSVAILDRRAVTQDATEAEVNGYLAEILRNTPDLTASGPLKFELRSINVAFRGGDVVTVLVSALGPIPLTYEIRAKPARVDDRFTLDVRGLRMGHLPLPRAIAVRTASRMARMFDQMEREKRLLDQLSSVAVVEDGVVRAATPGA